MTEWTDCDAGSILESAVTLSVSCGGGGRGSILLSSPLFAVFLLGVGLLLLLSPRRFERVLCVVLC